MDATSYQNYMKMGSAKRISNMVLRRSQRKIKILRRKGEAFSKHCVNGFYTHIFFIFAS